MKLLLCEISYQNPGLLILYLCMYILAIDLVCKEELHVIYLGSSALGPNRKEVASMQHQRNIEVSPTAKFSFYLEKITLVKIIYSL